MTNSRSKPALPAWRGDVAIGDAVLAFRGDSADNRFHAHAAVQCVFSATGTEVIDTDEKSFRGPGWLIRSGVSHCLRPAAGLVLLLIEPQSRIAARLLKLADPSSIAPLPSVVADYCAASASADELVQGLSTLGVVPG